jgi:hypothetical protein
MSDEHVSNANTVAHPEDVDRLVSDFEQRTLSELKGRFSQLVYIASLRDYNSGRYHHYGLETRYPEPAVDEGLRRCHTRVFEELIGLSLQEQTEDLLDFFESLKEDRARLVNVWKRLKSYQILPPEDCHPLARELFEKNTEIILKILRETDLWPLLHDPHRDADDLP